LLFPDPEGNIGTDLSADGATGTGSLIIPADIEISLPVDLLPDPDQFFRTGNGAEPAPLTAFNVNLDFGHHQMPGIM
jgi:hypothetical protein